MNCSEIKIVYHFSRYKKDWPGPKGRKQQQGQQGQQGQGTRQRRERKVEPGSERSFYKNHKNLKTNRWVWKWIEFLSCKSLLNLFFGCLSHVAAWQGEDEIGLYLLNLEIVTIYHTTPIHLDYTFVPYELELDSKSSTKPILESEFNSLSFKFFHLMPCVKKNISPKSSQYTVQFKYWMHHKIE